MDAQKIKPGMKLKIVSLPNAYPVKLRVGVDGEIGDTIIAREVLHRPQLSSPADWIVLFDAPGVESNWIISNDGTTKMFKDTYGVMACLVEPVELIAKECTCSKETICSKGCICGHWQQVKAARKAQCLGK